MTELEASLSEVVEAQRIVGLSVAVVRPGRAVWTAAFGHADLASMARSSAGTSYLWFSMTKVVTATAVMQLVDDDRVDLDAAVEHYFSEFGVVRQREKVTVRHLLSHSSGLANPVPVRWVHAAGTAAPDPDVFLASQLRRHRRLRFRPGSRASYSNLGYLVLGQVVANAAGITYADYVRRNVLAPLAMTDTDFDRPRAPNEATIYQRGGPMVASLLRVVLPRDTVGERTGRRVGYRPFRLHGSAYGGLVGPVEDAAKFLGAHLAGGTWDDARILDASSVALMQEITTPGRRYDLGLGWFRRVPAREARPRYVEHLGGGLGIYNTMRIYPELDLGVVVMANSPGYDLEAVIRPIVESIA